MGANTEVRRKAAQARWAGRFSDLLAQSRLGRTDDECHPWAGVTTKGGYPTYAGKYVHRLIAECPPHLVTRHTCDNPPCINRRHLVNGTQRQNIEDAVERKRMGRPRKTSPHCKWQHEYTPENTRWTADGYRACRTCDRAKSQRHRAKG